ncbi:type VII secretion target [Prauserella rugosa]|uniref:Excreted virulence factor EspC (Type VII ESX diderm) n=1 Tax=Prauserella rugosa TaxID=43354 RepID=A0A660CDR8_9PSEU|nr:type VII secretion target [Prauserella rugosa]KID29263.1 Protein of unknown function (DUF2580) [Prauserella sp. Am3]TWH21476.1 excreted virulence factor EspC (type VII ESX diderm) [Prauserella rugosa]
MASESGSEAGEGGAIVEGGAAVEGVEAVGSGATGFPASVAGSPIPAVPSAKDIDVAPDKVGEVARIIDEQADQLDRKLSEHLGSLRIPAPAEDTVSQHAVGVWNDVVSGPEDSYAAHARSYVTQLRGLASQLRRAGEEYTRSDQEKADTFGDRRGFPA